MQSALSRHSDSCEIVMVMEGSHVRWSGAKLLAAQLDARARGLRSNWRFVVPGGKSAFDRCSDVEACIHQSEIAVLHCGGLVKQ